jgi:hypothetical protein
MEVGKFFAGVIMVVIGVLLKDGTPASLWSKVGIILLVGSVGFCVATVLACDRLLMPRKYWTGLHEDDRAEARFQDKLRRNLDRSWVWLFIPAVVCFGLGFVFVLIQALQVPGAERTLPPSAESALLALLLAAAVGLPIVAGIIEKPQIRD